MATLKVLFDASTADRFPVYAQYGGQFQPQPAYLELDIRTGELNADYSGEIGNAVPSDVWHGLVLRFAIQPEARASEIERIINENKDTFQKILDGSETYWDGNNTVGRLSDDAREIIERIEQMCEFCDTEGGIIDLAEWIQDNPFPSNGQSVDDFADEVLASDGENGYYFLRENMGTDEMLSELRDVWAEMLYAGHDISKAVAQHLIEHGTCDDSNWMDELREFAAA